jgi:hypothetical protein
MQRETSADAEPALQWFAYHEGEWAPAAEPSPDAPEPESDVPATGTAPASVPATAAAVAGDAVVPPAPVTTRPLRVETLASRSGAVVPADAKGVEAAPRAAALPPSTISPFSNPGMLPEEEMWWTEPGESYTTVWHYMPLDEISSQRLGFVVPTFVFDDSQAAINLKQKVLYILHDGHLIALPIPAAAFGRK